MSAPPRKNDFNRHGTTSLRAISTSRKLPMPKIANTIAKSVSVMVSLPGRQWSWLA